MAATSYDVVLARNVRAARSRAGLNQELVAARMRALGFSEWRQSTVGRAELGKRRVMAGEVVWLSVALQTNLAALLMPVVDDGPVGSPSGAVVVDGTAIAESLGGISLGAVTWPGGGDKPVFVPPG